MWLSFTRLHAVPELFSFLAIICWSPANSLIPLNSKQSQGLSPLPVILWSYCCSTHHILLWLFVFLFWVFIMRPLKVGTRSQHFCLPSIWHIFAVYGFFFFFKSNGPLILAPHFVFIPFSLIGMNSLHPFTSHLPCQLRVMGFLPSSLPRALLARSAMTCTLPNPNNTFQHWNYLIYPMPLTLRTTLLL